MPPLRRMFRTENLYGHRKKLLFVERRLRNWREVHGRAPRVIDIGCGTGDVLTLPLAEFGYHVLGIDTHQPSIELARSLGSFSTLSYRCCNLDQIDETFDAAILSEVLEHLDDPAELVRKTLRVLSKKSILLITVPNGYGPFEAEKFLWKALYMDTVWTAGLLPRLKRMKSWLTGSTFRPMGVPTNSLDVSPHVQFFTKRSLLSLFQHCGCELSAFEKGSFLAGPFTDTFLPRIPTMIRLNASVARILPAWAVSGWYCEFSVTSKP